PLGEVGIEMTMEDRIAHGLVSIAAAVVNHLQRKGRTGHDELAVKIGPFVRTGRAQPLMGMEMMSMRVASAGVVNPHCHMIVDVAVVDVRGVVREIDLFGSFAFVWWLVRIRLRRGVDKHCGITASPGAQEKLLELQVDSVAIHSLGAHPETIRHDLGANRADAVVDCKLILPGGEHPEFRLLGSKGLRYVAEIVITQSEFPIRLSPVG